MNNYDVIIIGAGSVGTPLAMYLGREGRKVLVIDEKPSPGQGQNKRAIGGIRATHSDRSKILICQKSLEIFSTWEEVYGDSIEWEKGGYSYPAYTEAHEKTYKELLVKQKEYGLNIEWYDRDDYLKMFPMINPEGLRGGTFSPDDGSASPMRSANAFYFNALENGVTFQFREKVTAMEKKGARITGVTTDKGTYHGAVVVNAAGGYATEVARLADIDVPVNPDSHEGGITDAVQDLLPTMIVDMREAPGSKNYYFYQHKTGQFIFCITPSPAIVGRDERPTSVFLPQISRRMIDLMPVLKNLNVRRTWRGLYPNTPDGFPIVGFTRDVENYYNMVGMCGQGYMLGPGLGYYASRDILGELTGRDKEILNDLTLYRDFSGQEAFK
ncbi:MAG TPA: FAD-binding oxidoreductase [Candidatus Mcinerneyibacteriales bacterium]|nr:FAD-binding oxidoreductase [Candidatus Mcinerneyibacteriales bacterium]